MSVLSFRYTLVAFLDKPPPWVRPGVTGGYRPRVRIRVKGQNAGQDYGDAVLDTGADKLADPSQRPGATAPNCLQFSYQPHPRQPDRLLPLVPVKLSGMTDCVQALVDTGAVFSVFPWRYASEIGVKFLDDGKWKIP